MNLDQSVIDYAALTMGSRVIYALPALLQNWGAFFHGHLNNSVRRDENRIHPAV